MLDTLEWTLQKLLSWTQKNQVMSQMNQTMKKQRGVGRENMKIIKKGPAMRVIFFYPGEEGTYVDHADVTLYENGIVHITSNQEETTTHLQNCEILWRFETDAEDRVSKVRLLKPKTELRTGEEALTSQGDSKIESKNPDLLD